MAHTEQKIVITEPRFKTKPFQHQAACLTGYGRREYFALLAEQGTGKTWIMINNMADLWASDDCDVVIILAPNGVHQNWTCIELPKHMPDWVRYKAAAWVASPNRTDKLALTRLSANAGSGELRILTMNWEALRTDRGMKFAQDFACTGRRVMVIGDEADVIKNPSTATAKHFLKLKNYAQWRRIMTGTLINNAPFDAFLPFSFLNEAILGTSSFYAFKAEYAEMLQDGNPLMRAIKQRGGLRFTPQVVARGPGGRPRYRNLDKLNRIIAPHSFRVLKSECLDLPKKIYKTLVFDLTQEQAVVYRAAAKECRAVFEGTTDVFSKLVATTRLAQITSGYFRHSMADEPVRIKGANPKLQLLKEKVERLVADGEKVIIWAWSRVEIADIAEALKELRCVEYHGGIKQGKPRLAAIEAFERGDANVFIANQKTGGTGITLVAGRHVIYFSNDYSLRNRLQSEDRAHRIGQEREVIYWNIVARGTVDEKVVRVLTGKQEVADAILDFGPAIFDFEKEER